MLTDTEIRRDLRKYFAGTPSRHTLLELAFSWLLSHRVVASVIAGAMTPEQVRANIAAAGWDLSADDLAEIDRLAPLGD